MSGERGSRLGSFVLGGIVGGLAGLAAGRLRLRPDHRPPPEPHGLSAFEEAPCYNEPAQLERRESERGGGRA